MPVGFITIPAGKVSPAKLFVTIPIGNNTWSLGKERIAVGFNIMPIGKRRPDKLIGTKSVGIDTILAGKVSPAKLFVAMPVRKDILSLGKETIPAGFDVIPTGKVRSPKLNHSMPVGFVTIPIGKRREPKLIYIKHKAEILPLPLAIVAVILFRAKDFVGRIKRYRRRARLRVKRNGTSRERPKLFTPRIIAIKVL